MAWQDGVAYFFGGVFLANFTPHFIAGVSGRPFHSPFATPPFRGLSSPVVNVLWALFNLAVVYATRQPPDKDKALRADQVAAAHPGSLSEDSDMIHIEHTFDNIIEQHDLFSRDE